jgi:hypothetical protein
MTDKELMQQALDALDKISMGGDPRWADNVIPALRTALAQPEPEPVAFMDYFGQVFNPAENQCYIRWTMRDRLPMEEDEVLIPLYTTQLRHEWVGLTDEEYEAMAEQYLPNCYFHTLKYAKAIETKLKDKNT